MNYVAGAIIIAIVDPKLKGMITNESKIKPIPELNMFIGYSIVTYSENITETSSKVISIFHKMISFLNLHYMWGYGFPLLPFYTEALKEFLSYFF
jgi:hypothetical protein